MFTVHRIWTVSMRKSNNLNHISLEYTFIKGWWSFIPFVLYIPVETFVVMKFYLIIRKKLSKPHYWILMLFERKDRTLFTERVSHVVRLLLETKSNISTLIWWWWFSLNFKKRWVNHDASCIDLNKGKVSDMSKCMRRKGSMCGLQIFCWKYVYLHCTQTE